jgi:hypothetical protein
MNIDNLSNKQSLSLGHTEQQDKVSRTKKVDHEVWSIECTIEELQLDLCRVLEDIIVCPKEGNESKGTKTLTVHKYYQQANDLAKWIPIARPAPEFIINAKDLSPGVIEELESRLDDIPTLTYILKQAVGRIFENLGHAYFRMSIARNLRVKIEP